MGINSRWLGCVLGVLTICALPLEGHAAPASLLLTGDTTPPQVTLTSPAPGATLSGSVKLTVAATDDVGVTRVLYLVDDGGVFAAETGAPFETGWSTTNVPDGPHTVTAYAYDAAGNVSLPSTVQVTVKQYGYAAYDSTLKVPACHELASRCTTHTLLDGRAGLGPEKNTPNTIYNSCVDGTDGTYRYTESLEEIRVIRTDGTHLAAGKKVRVEVYVYVYNFLTNTLDLFSAADATNPEWTYLTTLHPTANGLQKLVMEYTLPSGSLQALRGSFRESGFHQPCSTGRWDDRDDVVFAVGQEEDNESPTVALSAPASGAVLRGTTILTAAADDNFGVKKVEFYVGSTLLHTDELGPYDHWWDTTSLAHGTYTLTAKAYDAAGHVVTSQGVTVLVDNTAPSVSFTAPQNGATLRGTVPLQVSASDNQQLVKVELYDGSTLLATDTAAPYALSWNTAAVADGARTLTATAYDSAGNTSSATLSVYVDNTAPTVAITSPAPGASVFLLTTIAASASDNRAVTKVEFYDGASLIGTDTTSPYSVSWSTLSVPKGSHTLTARAYDAAGHVTTSAAVTVQVK